MHAVWFIKKYLKSFCCLTMTMCNAGVVIFSKHQEQMGNARFLYFHQINHANLKNHYLVRNLGEWLEKVTALNGVRTQTANNSKQLSFFIFSVADVLKLGTKMLQQVLSSPWFVSQSSHSSWIWVQQSTNCEYCAKVLKFGRTLQLKLKLRLHRSSFKCAVKIVHQEF